jgi:hypothetical protein
MQNKGMPKQIARAATEVITKKDHHEKDGEMRYKRRRSRIFFKKAFCALEYTNICLRNFR